MILLCDPKDLDRRYDRQIKFLGWLAWCLAWLILGVILGRLICGK